MTRGARRILLVLPALVLGQLDAAITLYGQSARYWSGDHGDVNEASPTFAWLLGVHPLAFEAGILAWLAILTLGVLLVAEPLALTFSIAVALGHAFGFSTWLYFELGGYQLVNGLMLATAAALGACISVGHRPAEPFALFGWPASRRHAVASLLVAIGVYLFLVPH